MANPDRRPIDTTVQPAGVEGEGLDPYPTYRDGPASPHHPTATKPTDVALPRSRRSHWLPFFIALVVFGLIILVRLVWSGFELANTTDEALTPEPAGSQPTAIAPQNTSPEAEPGSPSHEDVQPDTGTGPGNVESTPGPIDVPGGATTTPTAPEPAQ
jgi:hypothetical protein